MQCNGSTVVDPYKTNWVWGKIRINRTNFNMLSAFNREGTVAHEMGHVMGLSDNPWDQCIMMQLGSGRTVNNAQADDAYGINAIY